MHGKECHKVWCKAAGRGAGCACCKHDWSLLLCYKQAPQPLFQAVNPFLGGMFGAR